MRVQKSPVKLGSPIEKTAGIGFLKRAALQYNLFYPDGFWEGGGHSNWEASGSSTVGPLFGFFPSLPLVAINDSSGAYLELNGDSGVLYNDLIDGRSYTLSGTFFINFNGIADAEVSVKLKGDNTVTSTPVTGSLWMPFALKGGICSNSNFKLKVQGTAGTNVTFQNLRLQHI